MGASLPRVTSGNRCACSSPPAVHCAALSLAAQGRKELEVSFFQTLVLLLFNAADALPFTRIKELTGVGECERCS